MFCKIWDFHSGNHEDCCLLGCYAIWLLQEPHGITSQETAFFKIVFLIFVKTLWHQYKFIIIFQLKLWCRVFFHVSFKKVKYEMTHEYKCTHLNVNLPLISELIQLISLYTIIKQSYKSLRLSDMPWFWPQYYRAMVVSKSCRLNTETAMW
jgi:signal transduction histidine kinase